ncbi:hypothetical protein F8M49_20280 [Rhodococcus zopfii]|uniref:Uncharacterized protein n=1 Tax=Rhodococcus zopfii TaxID=43772 RepID=A0ABU3WSX0_9NOCA|nr:hypothetical protein [Rhodococcus zopfii]
MIVSTDIRLASMLSALTGTILPEIAEHGFAREQAELLAGHLNALRVQGAFAEEFERLEFNYTRNLAREILRDSTGGEMTTAATARVQSALDEKAPTDITDIRAAQSILTSLIAELVSAQGIDGGAASVVWSTRTIVDAEHGQSLRDRSFFSPFGYESGSDEVKPIEEMMGDFRKQFNEDSGATR